MNRQTSRMKAPMVGGSSLLVIFAVLCLTMFAMLGFSTAQANRRLANASIAAVTSFYQADCEAEAILARLRNGETVEGVASDGEFYRFTCPVSNTQKLLVEARIQDETNWEILTWQSVSTMQRNADELLTVWSGDSMTDYE